MVNVTVTFNNNTFTANTNNFNNMNISQIKATLISSGDYNYDKKVVVGVEKTRVNTKRNKSGFQHSKVKRTLVFQTQTFVDIAAVNRMAKSIASELAKQAELDRVAAEAFKLEKEMASKALVAEISHLDNQIAKARALNPRRVLTKKPMVKQIKTIVRTTQKPARLRIPSVTKVCFIGKLAPVAIPVRESKVSRMEAQALLAHSLERPFLRKRTSVIEAIAAFARVDSLVERALLAVATGEAFINAAKARMTETVNTLPAVAQTMTMSMTNNSRLEDLLKTPREEAIKYFNEQANELEETAKILAEDFGSLEDALSDGVFDWNKEHTVADLTLLIIARDEVEGYIHNGGFEEYANSLDMTIDEYISVNNCDDDCFPFGRENMSNNRTTIDRPVINRGDGNLSKNVTVEEANPSSESPKTTTGDSPIKTYTFADKFPVYNNLVVDNGSHSVANILFAIASELRAPNEKRKGTKIYENQMARYNAALVKQEEMLTKWQNALGYIDPVDIYVDETYKLVRNNNAVELDVLLNAFNFVTFSEEEVYVAGRKATKVPQDYNCRDFGKHTTAQQLFFTIVGEVIADLGAGDKVELLCDLFPEKVEGNFFERESDTALRILHASFDFEAGTVAKNGYILEVNRGTMFRDVNVDMLGKDALFMLALSFAKQSKKAINTRLGMASNLFKRQENYGAKAESDDIRYHVNNNLVLCAKVKSTATFPFFSVVTAKQDGKALSHILGKGIFAAVDKTNVSWITVEDGAAAMGLGVKDGLILNASDASKPNKVYNRPASNKYLFAAQVAENGLDLRERSNFAFMLPHCGGLAYIKGRKLNTIFSNSRFGLGSGIAITNPGLRFPHQVATNVTEPLNLLTLPAEWRNAFGSMDEFAKHVAAKVKDSIESRKGSVIKPGQVIGEIKLGNTEETRVVITNTKQAVDVKVMSSTVTVDDFNDNVLNVSVKVEIAGNDRFVKLRTPFYKATTHPMDVRIGGVAPSEWDILLNIECVKGQNLLAVMWANAHGLTKVDMTEGVAHVGNRTIDLKVFDNEITEWRRANTRKTVLTHRIARSVFEELKHQMILDDVEIVSVGKREVVVKETVEYIKGHAHFDIEIATPRESVGTSSLTFEQQNAVLLQDRKLGEDIMRGLGKKVSNLKSLIANYAETKGKTVSFDCSTREGRKAFATFAFGAVGGFVKYATNHRGVIRCIDKALEKANASKLEITHDMKETVTISPKSLLAFGQFSRNGSSAREAAKIVDFLFYLVNCDESNDSESVLKAAIREANQVIDKWASNLVASPKALKKVTRAGELVCGKVRTSWLPVLHSTDGIPVIALNPTCPMRRMLGVEHGDLVAINRTPMPFITVARVVFTDEIDVAHAAISPLWWHLANEGDSDGDGIGIMSLEGFGVTRDRAKAINNALMGPAGYLWMYGNVRTYDEFVSMDPAARPALPFDDFMSYDDKHGKKALSFNADNSLPFVTSSIKGTDFDLEAYAEYAKLVNSHYKAAVGSSYAICSQLVFAAAELVYHTGEFDVVRKERTIEACVVAWRLIYEGLGLAGWSANATNFFTYFKPAALDYEQGRVKVQDNGRITSFYSRKGKELDAKNTLKMCLAEAGLNEAVNDNTLLSSLLRSQAVVTVYQKLERGDKVNRSVDHLENAAIIAGTLRRIGQGKDPVVVEADPGFDMSEEDEGPLSMTEAFHERGFGALLANRAIGTVAGAACEAHVTIRDIYRGSLTAQ